MGVDTDLLAVFFAGFQIPLCQLTHLQRIQRTVTVYQIDDFHAALAQHFQCFCQFRFLCLGNCHDVHCGVIALFRTGFDHVNGCRNGVDIGGDPHHIQNAVLLVRQIPCHVGTSYVCHNCQLHLRVENVDQHLLNSIFMAELPLAELGFLEQLRICQIADFHHIDTGTYIGQIQLPDEVVCKLKVVYQSAVPNGSVQHFDVRTIGDHGTLYHIAHWRFLISVSFSTAVVTAFL